nr:hypothetical protein CFP56_79420 [Quercus suber]
MSVSSGGYPSPVTPRGRIPVHGRTPECVWLNNGQWPVTYRLPQRRPIRNESFALRTPHLSPASNQIAGWCVQGRLPATTVPSP